MEKTATNQQFDQLWTSLLFVPAHIERFVQSAHTRSASAIVLDLEDSVPLAAKESARLHAQSAIELFMSQQVDCLVRVNRELDLCVEDLQSVVRPGVQAICLPKVMGADHVKLIDEQISSLETEQGLTAGRIGILAMIETIEALMSVEAIARSCPRLMGIGIGSEDLSLDAGFEPSPENLFDPCQRILYATRMAGIKAFGFPGSIADFSHLDEFAVQIGRAKSMGFDGALCIHPAQVSVMNDIYKADKESIEQAEKIVQAFDALEQKEQSGAINIDGKMVDLPVVERSRRLLSALEAR